MFENWPAYWSIFSQNICLIEQETVPKSSLIYDEGFLGIARKLASLFVAIFPEDLFDRKKERF